MNSIAEAFAAIDDGPDLLSGLTPAQIAFVRDPARHKAALCSRQSGKTEALLRCLFFICVSLAAANCIYINRTLRQAKTNVWQRINDLIHRFKLQVKINVVDQNVTFANGSVLYISGAETQADADRFRGMIAAAVVIDEAQSIPDSILDYLLGKVIPACLLIHKGPVMLTGTPNPVCFGKFYEITRDDSPLQWSVHRWTWETNPAVTDHQAFMDEQLRVNGWKLTDPGWLTEFGGKWVRDENVLLYRYDEKLNGWDGKLGVGDWFNVLGVDIGYRDWSTFTLASYGLKTKYLYFRESQGASKLITHAVAERIQKFIDRMPIHKVIMDCGALGLMMAEELRQRYQLPIEAAEKREKLAMIKLMNSDFQRSIIKVDTEQCRELTHQWRTLTKTEDGGEEPTQRNDFADSGLYAYRHCRQYLYREPQPDRETYTQKLEREAWSRTEEQYDLDPIRQLGFNADEAPPTGDWT